MSRLSGFRAAIGRLFGSVFFLVAALLTMAVWLLVLLFGTTGTDVGDAESVLFIPFPVAVGAFDMQTLIPADINMNLIYTAQCCIMVLLVAGIWSYQYSKAGSGQSVLSKLMLWTISIKFVVFYGFILPTILFYLNSSHLTDERDGLIELHDIQLFVLDQFFRSVVFDLLEAMKVSISGLDYADNSDFGFRLLVTIYRLSVPMWVFMVWRRVRAPRMSKPEVSASAAT